MRRDTFDRNDSICLFVVWSHAKLGQETCSLWWRRCNIVQHWKRLC